MSRPSAKWNAIRPATTGSKRSIVARTWSRRPKANGAATMPTAMNGESAACDIAWLARDERGDALSALAWPRRCECKGVNRNYAHVAFARHHRAAALGVRFCVA